MRESRESTFIWSKSSGGVYSHFYAFIVSQFMALVAVGYQLQCMIAVRVLFC